jgi:hypothetical protein
MSKKKNKKKAPEPKTRNWLALHAKGLTGRKGAGAHSGRGWNRTLEKRKLLKEMR